MIKKKEQSFADIVLPIFDQPEEPKARELSKKEAEDNATKVIWRRYRGAARMCEDCFPEVNSGDRLAFGKASWVRVEGSVQRAICFEHKALRMEQEDLNRPRGDE
jgi:hypothetical protein